MRLLEQPAEATIHANAARPYGDGAADIEMGTNTTSLISRTWRDSICYGMVVQDR